MVNHGRDLAIQGCVLAMQERNLVIKGCVLSMQGRDDSTGVGREGRGLTRGVVSDDDVTCFV